MDNSKKYFDFRIRKRPWYIWLMRTIWLLWLIFWLEIAIGSWREMEYHANSISLRIFIISLILGLVLYSWRLRNFKKMDMVDD